MKSTEYKRQFLQYLKTAFPNGLPAGAEPRINFGLLLEDGTLSRFEFHFEMKDYEDFLLGTQNETKEAFTESLTSQDAKFLKDIRISISNVEIKEQ